VQRDGPRPQQPAVSALGARHPPPRHVAAMLQSAVDAIISTDDAGTIESVNPATEQLCAVAPEGAGTTSPP